MTPTNNNMLFVGVCYVYPKIRRLKMKTYILVGLGGVIGAILRFGIKNMSVFNWHGGIPLNTLIINMTGTFALAFILTVAFEVWELDECIRIGITTGFLGAYTTFSTLCKESVNLMQKGLYDSFILYIIISMGIGFLLMHIGVFLAREVASKIIKTENKLREVE